jgi:hypothetical protein
MSVQPVELAAAMTTCSRWYDQRICDAFGLTSCKPKVA